MILLAWKGKIVDAEGGISFALSLMIYCEIRVREEWA